MGGLWALLGLFGGSGRPLGAVLGSIAQKEGRRLFRSPLRRLKNAVLGPSWAALGALLGAVGAALGSSWAPLGAILGRSWEPSERSWSHLGGDRSKKGGLLIPIAPSEAQKERLGALLGRSWSALGRSWGRLGALLGPSWGSLGPSWGHLEASRAHRKRKGEKAKNIDFP